MIITLHYIYICNVFYCCSAHCWSDSSYGKTSIFSDRIL